MTDRVASGGADELLRAEGISVWLSGREVLHDVGFTLRRGEFAALIGSNGAGKTTLLKVILGLQATSAGMIRVAGQSRGRRHPVIGYVPQKIQLDPDMPVRARDLVGLGLDGQRLGLPLPSAGRRARIDEMLRAVGAERFGDARVGTLSGGEQQRVLIAHALISRPQLLLLDEPLANLDIASEQDVVALLSRVAREQQIAVLISAHDMNPLLPVMDRIIYLAAGRAASGTTEEVVRTDVLSALYGQHVDVIRVHDRILVVAGRGEAQPVPPDPAIHPDGPAVADPGTAPEIAGEHSAGEHAAGEHSAGEHAAGAHSAGEHAAAEHAAGRGDAAAAATSGRDWVT